VDQRQIETGVGELGVQFEGSADELHGIGIAAGLVREDAHQMHGACVLRVCIQNFCVSLLCLRVVPFFMQAHGLFERTVYIQAASGGSVGL